MKSPSCAGMKPLLAQVGLHDEADMVVEKDCIVLRRPQAKVREGWAEASQRIAAAGDCRISRDWTPLIS